MQSKDWRRITACSHRFMISGVTGNHQDCTGELTLFIMTVMIKRSHGTNEIIRKNETTKQVVFVISLPPNLCRYSRSA